MPSVLILPCSTQTPYRLPLQAVVFCNWRRDAEELESRLQAAGFPCAYLSAAKQQLERIDALNALRDFRWGRREGQREGQRGQREGQREGFLQKVPCLVFVSAASGVCLAGSCWAGWNVGHGGHGKV